MAKNVLLGANCWLWTTALKKRPIGASSWNHSWALGIGVPQARLQHTPQWWAEAFWCLQKTLSCREVRTLLLEPKVPPPPCWDLFSVFCSQQTHQAIFHFFTPDLPTQAPWPQAKRWGNLIFHNPQGQLKALVMLLASNVFMTYYVFPSSICCGLLEINIQWHHYSFGSPRRKQLHILHVFKHIYQNNSGALSHVPSMLLQAVTNSMPIPEVSGGCTNLVLINTFPARG